MLGKGGSSELTGRADSHDGSELHSVGKIKCSFILQWDSHSAGCTCQMLPNRVSADSPSRILPRNVLESL